MAISLKVKKLRDCFALLAMTTRVLREGFDILCLRMLFPLDLFGKVFLDS